MHSASGVVPQGRVLPVSAAGLLLVAGCAWAQEQAQLPVTSAEQAQPPVATAEQAQLPVRSVEQAELPVTSVEQAVVQHTVMQQVCESAGVARSTPSSGAASIAGALIGGAFGNAVAQGPAQAAATVIGALAGAAVAQQSEANQAAATAVTRCVLQPSVVNLQAYRVRFAYAGQTFEAFLAEAPGPTLPVQISARASDGAVTLAVLAAPAILTGQLPPVMPTAAPGPEVSGASPSLSPPQTTIYASSLPQTTIYASSPPQTTVYASSLPQTTVITYAYSVPRVYGYPFIHPHPLALGYRYVYPFTAYPAYPRLSFGWTYHGYGRRWR